jgi:hypothetical protein
MTFLIFSVLLQWTVNIIIRFYDQSDQVKFCSLPTYCMYQRINLFLSFSLLLSVSILLKVITLSRAYCVIEF